MSCFRLTSLFALTLGVSLALGALPRDAWADVCGNNAGCVVPRDVSKGAVRARNRVDEAGTNFVSQLNAPKMIDGFPEIYASIVIKAPAKGTVIINASITVEALKNPSQATGVPHGKGTVECALTDGGNVIATNNPNRFFGSVDWVEKFEFETMVITSGVRLSGPTSKKIALACKLLPGGSSTSRGLVRVRSPSISAAYYSNL